MIGEFTYKRNLVKQWIFSSMVNRGRNYLFEQTLVKKGEANFKFNSIGDIHNFIERFKESMRELIRIVLECKELHQTIKINVEQEV